MCVIIDILIRYNEMEPPEGTVEYLSSSTIGVYSAMKAADPEVSQLVQPEHLADQLRLYG